MSKPTRLLTTENGEQSREVQNIKDSTSLIASEDPMQLNTNQHRIKQHIFSRYWMKSTWEQID